MFTCDLASSRNSLTTTCIAWSQSNYSQITRVTSGIENTYCNYLWVLQGQHMLQNNWLCIVCAVQGERNTVNVVSGRKATPEVATIFNVVISTPDKPKQRVKSSKKHCFGIQHEFHVNYYALQIHNSERHFGNVKYFFRNFRRHVQPVVEGRDYWPEQVSPWSGQKVIQGL